VKTHHVLLDHCDTSETACSVVPHRPASRFLGSVGAAGEYQAGVLGLLTADTRLFRQILHAPVREDDSIGGGLLSRPDTMTWQAFVEELTPTRASDALSTQDLDELRLPGAVPAGPPSAPDTPPARCLPPELPT
jgi:hypothetical protein